VVPAVKPDRLLVNGLVVPSVVFVGNAVVGLTEVLQQTPCVVIAAPPVAVTVPPDAAEVPVIAVIAVVVIVGATANVVKLSSSP
jgi:hypothetical protein